MTKLEKLILNLKKTNRDNFYFLRRRVDKGNGKKSLGWILKREDTNKYLESLDFYKLHNSMNKLKKCFIKFRNICNYS